MKAIMLETEEMTKAREARNDVKNNLITILRVLKDRQNWKFILNNEDQYSF